MTIIRTQNLDQRDAVLDLIRWFDNDASSLHHALIMAAERNEADATDEEVAQFPAVVDTLKESGQRWRQIAARVLELHEKVGDVEEIDNLTLAYTR